MFALVTTQLAFGCIAAKKPGVEAPTGPPADTTVTSSGVLLCEAPEERDTLGPMYTPDWGDEWAAQPEYEDENAADPGWGVAIEDFDGDGVLEILLANPFGTQLYEWDPDTHAMVEHTPQLPSLSSHDVRSASAGDYDGDGDLDLYLGVSKGADLLLRNDGAGAFEDVTRSAGLLEETWTGTSATWGDVNGDGNLELFVANSASLAEVSSDGEPDHNVYYLNNGDGTLSDATRTLPEDAQTGFTMVAGFLDLDDDVDLDLYLVNHLGPFYTPNVFLQNEGGALVEGSDDSGLNVALGGMGLGVGDINGDWIPDLLVSGWGEVLLLESAADGAWYDGSLARGLVPDAEAGSVVAWGNDLADYDNDGDLDAFVSYGKIDVGDAPEFENPRSQPDELWIQSRSGTFTQVADSWGLADYGMQRGVAVADLNDDGYLDIVTRKIRSSTGVQVSRCGADSWARISLRQPGPNAHGVGARVRVEAGGTTQVRWITDGATGLSGSSPLEAHFGLGAADTIDRITVRWPDGHESSVEDLDARQKVRITREPSPT